MGNVVEKLRICEVYDSSVRHYKKMRVNLASLPSLAEILVSVEDQEEFLEYKYSQGFNYFLLVNYSDKIDKFYKLRKMYERAAIKGLYYDNPLKSPICSMRSISCNYKIEEALYYPTNFSSKEEGVERPTLRSNRWEAHIVPNKFLKSKRFISMIGDRPSFTDKLTVNEILGLLHGTLTQYPNHSVPVVKNGISVYKGERGLTLEVWLAYAYRKLKEEKVIPACDPEEYRQELLGITRHSPKLYTGNLFSVDCKDADFSLIEEVNTRGLVTCQGPITSVRVY